MKQETVKRRAPWLTALMAGAMLVSCSNDMQMPSGGADGSAEGKITFKISLPSTEKVIYGGGTRAIHDEAEYNVTTLDVYEYDVNTGFVAKHTFSAADGSIRPAGEGNITGEYTVTITEDLAEVGSLRRFYFVANNANGVTPAKGTDYETGLRDEAADIALASGTGSSVLCPEGGIAMSGLAVNTETNGSDITIKSGAMNNVHVDLTRIVGRVDLYSNADNLVITGARMESASAKGYLMAEHAPLSTLSPGEIDVLDINANAGVAASGEVCLPAANAGYSAEISAIQQYNDGNGTGVRKAFYMYERDNSEGDCTQIVVSYALADGTTGEAVVPFTKTDETTGTVSYVNIERNHLYKVVLGNGQDITPGSQVEVKIIDTPWNVVDLPVVVEGPDSPDVVLPTSYDVVIDDVHSTLASALKAAGCPITVDDEFGVYVPDEAGKAALYAIESLKISKLVGTEYSILDDYDWTFLREGVLGVINDVCNSSLRSLDLSGISFENDEITYDNLHGAYGGSIRECPIEEVMLPDNLQTIGNDAFKNMWHLRKMIIPTSVSSIGDSAFQGCLELSDVGLDGLIDYSNLTSIGRFAFYFTGIETLDLSRTSITSIDLGSSDNGVLLNLNEFIEDGGKEITTEEYVEAVKLKTIIFPHTASNLFRDSGWGGFPNLELIDISRCVDYQDNIDGSGLMTLPPDGVAVKLPVFNSTESRDEFNQQVRSLLDGSSFVTYVTMTLQYPSDDASYWTSYGEITNDSKQISLRYESY